MGPVVPTEPGRLHQPHKDLIDQVGGLHGVAGALARQIAVRQPVQIIVDDFRKLIERLLVAGTPSAEQIGDFLSGTRRYNASTNLRARGGRLKP